MARAGDGTPRSNKRRRQKTLQKRVSDEELARFIERAQDAGYDHHRDYLSALILGESEVVRRDRQDLLRIRGELNKHSSNLNQIAHAANAGRIAALSADDRRLIEAARAAVLDLSNQILDALR